MSRDKKRTIKDVQISRKERERLSGAYKREVFKDLISHFHNYYPQLNRRQVRRIFSFAYQSLREGRKP